MMLPLFHAVTSKVSASPSKSPGEPQTRWLLGRNLLTHCDVVWLFIDLCDSFIRAFFNVKNCGSDKSFSFLIPFQKAQRCWRGAGCPPFGQLVSCWLAADHPRVHAAGNGCCRLAFSTDGGGMTVFTRETVSLEPLLAPTAAAPFLSCLLKHWCGATRVITGHSRMVVFCKTAQGHWKVGIV